MARGEVLRLRPEPPCLFRARGRQVVVRAMDAGLRVRGPLPDSAVLKKADLVARDRCVLKVDLHYP